jgi:hypothetical protein
VSGVTDIPTCTRDDLAGLLLSSETGTEWRIEIDVRDCRFDREAGAGPRPSGVSAFRPIQASRPGGLEVLLSAESSTLAKSVHFPPEELRRHRRFTPRLMSPMV